MNASRRYIYLNQEKTTEQKRKDQARPPVAYLQERQLFIFVIQRPEQAALVQRIDEQLAAQQPDEEHRRSRRAAAAAAATRRGGHTARDEGRQIRQRRGQRHADAASTAAAAALRVAALGRHMKLYHREGGDGRRRRLVRSEVVVQQIDGPEVVQTSEE